MTETVHKSRAIFLARWPLKGARGNVQLPGDTGSMLLTQFGFELDRSVVIAERCMGGDGTEKIAPLTLRDTRSWVGSLLTRLMAVCERGGVLLGKCGRYGEMDPDRSHLVRSPYRDVPKITQLSVHGRNVPGLPLPEATRWLVQEFGALHKDVERLELFFIDHTGVWMSPGDGPNRNFVDAGQISVVSNQTLQVLAAQMEMNPVDLLRRLRINLVIDADPRMLRTCQKIVIRNRGNYMTLRRGPAIARCRVVGVDPQTGLCTPRVLARLAQSYRGDQLAKHEPGYIQPGASAGDLTPRQRKAVYCGSYFMIEGGMLTVALHTRIEQIDVHY